MSSARLLLLSLVSTALAAETFHRKSNLTVALADVVPACAEDCFISFLSANYGLARGEEIPSLEDLCSTDGNTGFTIGEGAVQCIAAEQTVGACSDKEADSYYMCRDEPGALTPTHGVITATLAVPPSGGGPISYPAPSKTKRPFTRMHPPTTLIIETHSPTFSPSWSPGTTLSTAVVSTTTEITGTSSSTAEPAAAASGGSITPVQKAGIAVGVIGFAAVAIGLLLLFRLYRARKKRGGHTPLASSPRRRDSWGYKFDKSRRESSSEPSWMANPVHPPNDSAQGPSAAAMTGAIAIGGQAGARTQQQPQSQPQAAMPKSPPPRAYNRSSWRPSLIGLALSPSHSKHTGQGTTTPTRPISKLLPAKPILSLDIPKKPPTPPPKHTPPPPGSSFRKQSATTLSPEYTRIASHPPVLPKLQIPQGHDFLHIPKSTNKPRESTMTEFEEDGRESSTVFSPESQIWSAPSAAPSSAAAKCHPVDRHGNWMPSDSNLVQAAELEGTTPLSAYPKLATSMAVLPVGTNGRGEQPGQGTAKRPSHRRSSSAPMPPNPAQQSIRVVTEPLATLKDGRDNVVPRPLFSDMGGNPRNASATASARHSFGRSLTRPRAASGDSGITNISVSSDEEHELQPPRRMSQANLSPVTESPRSGNGKSPVSYPKIPGRENGLSGKERSAQPPRMPIFYKSAHHRTASGGIGNSVAMLTVGSLAPNPNPNIPKETKNATSTSATIAGPPPNAFNPIIPTTKVTTASPHQWASASRGQRPMQNPGLPRTGSPTMRIVEPSPEPDDDRAMLPSARPRSVQSVQQSQPQRQQTQLQPSPFPASQQRSQQVATPAVEQRPEFQARSKTPAPVQSQPLNYSLGLRTKLVRSHNHGRSSSSMYNKLLKRRLKLEQARYDKASNGKLLPHTHLTSVNTKFARSKKLSHINNTDMQHNLTFRFDQPLYHGRTKSSPYPKPLLLKLSQKRELRNYNKNNHLIETLGHNSHRETTAHHKRKRNNNPQYNKPNGQTLPTGSPACPHILTPSAGPSTRAHSGYRRKPASATPARRGRRSRQSQTITSSLPCGLCGDNPYTRRHNRNSMPGSRSKRLHSNHSRTTNSSTLQFRRSEPTSPSPNTNNHKTKRQQIQANNRCTSTAPSNAPTRTLTPGPIQTRARNTTTPLSTLVNNNSNNNHHNHKANLGHNFNNPH
ncbi:hypothetical protein VCV18_008255 [Metarhizium anisopliae]